jgi:hypothetical protein
MDLCDRSTSAMVCSWHFCLKKVESDFTHLVEAPILFFLAVAVNFSQEPMGEFMKKIVFLMLMITLPVLADHPGEVCLLIDQRDTGNPKYPNQATDVKDPNKSFDVFHKKEACFEIGKKYYMQYFLWESRNTIVYGTRCYYEPKVGDNAKVLRYDGEHGGTPCPIVDEFRIDIE